ncbi:DNA-directed RNA polymerase III subunit rpc3 [Fulvia fulva]|uniref:DNA-directed RNA polymerase III subunit RPC3 n=1 Tax=Passalora fulva TaxID=5499 RepID=A0A9Q8P5Z1_PASFU|nr:DNA-directed RNA polymerase III subunit rpc3 [Fulvia fulva]UJO14503.1 DNA-directed RNA polymerase III subunit rpc3 [Fulvia fulva]WPV11584.1 DNA-directed RNA polymerase III subunit rpc3 [Fulvia fulva]
MEELCALLVQETCGQRAKKIFSTLATKGRLSHIQLQQHTRIPARQMRHALTVLIQQHLIRHHTADDELTFYQVDWRNTYYLLRSNRIITLVDDRHGEGAGKIISNLLQLGHARIGDLAQAFDLEPSKRDSGIERCAEHMNGEVKVNGVDNSHKVQHGKITTVPQFHGTIRRLLKAGFLIKFSPRMYKPSADLQTEAEESVISDSFPDRKITGSKKKNEFETAVRVLKRKWRDADDYNEYRDVDSRGIIHRPGEPVKRVRLNGGMTNGGHYSHGDDDLDDDNAPRLPNEMILKVNYAQCIAALRSDRLSHLAEPYLGPVTANVYGALLQALETKVRAKDDAERSKKDDDDEDEESDLPVATTAEVADLLDPSLDLNLGIHSDIQKVDSKDKKKRKLVDNEFADIGIKQEIGSESEDDDYQVNGHVSYEKRTKRLHLIEDHLRLLEEHPKTFCRRVGGGGGGEWKVHFPSLTDTLIQADIDSTVSARYGKISVRILRLLRERGRLEGKQIANLVMMRTKDVQAVLTILQYAGFVESQEIPKDGSRQPSRAVYLYFHEQSRVQSLMLQQTYQSMSRTLQRLGRERETYRSIIEKAQTVAMKDLPQPDRKALAEWRELEERLWLGVQRMDELVALFRDFSGRDVSLVS